MQKNKHSATSDMSKKPIDKLKTAIREQGLTIVGSKCCGKTNALMVILANMTEEIPCVIDFATVHAYELGSRFTVKFLDRNYLLRKPRININKPMIIDVSQTNKPIASEIIRELIKQQYYARVTEVIDNFRLGMEERKLEKPWLIFCLEEAQTTIGRYLTEDSDLKTAMCVGRNYNISFVFVTQRLSDLNTQLSERTAYLIGKIVGDNNTRKLSRLLGISRRKLKFVETLEKGEFLFYNGERIERLKFPLYNGSRAIEITSRIIKRKPKNLWQKLTQGFNEEEEPLIGQDEEGETDAIIEDEDLIEEELF